MGSRYNRLAEGPQGTTDAAAETLRLIGDATGVTVWRWDAAADRVTKDEFGTAPPDPGCTLTKKLRMLHPQDRRRVSRRLRDAALVDASGTFQFRTHPSGGPIRHLSAAHFPVGPHTQQIIVQDVTRAHLAEQALRESEDHHRHAVALNPEVPWLADAEGNIIEFGPRWLELVDLPAERTYGHGWTDALHPDDLQPTAQRWQAALASGDAVDIEYRLRMKAGGYRWMRARAAARRDGAGQIVRWYGTLEDIHDRKVAEAALRESEAFARSILEASAMAIEVLDIEGRLIFMNGPGMQIMEVDDFAAIKGTRFDAFWPETARPDVQTAIVAAQGGATVRRTLFGPTAKGSPRWWDITISPIRDGTGQVARLLALSSDVTEAKRNEAEIAHLARHDTLTGLPNRMHFQDRLNTAITAPGPRRIAVLSVDLDDFKVVNDTLGHQAGDLLLRAVAGRLRQCARKADVVARLGGDEFAVLVSLGQNDDAADMARAILGALDRPFSLDGETVSIGASIGIAEAPRDGGTAERLLHAADVALYRVKADKGHAFRYFEPEMDEALRQRREMKRDLAMALERREFALVYQPQVDIFTNKINGFEALLRWRSAKHGDVSPIEFIPLAEESGLIDEIGAFVLNAACAEATLWPDTIGIAVNFSAAQFRNHGAIRAVTDALASTGLDPARLEIEITESVLFDESVEAVAMLEAFHKMGVRVALDDFGTGYSSLSYLRRFAFDKIKIDRSFISDLPGAEESAAIVRAIIGLGRSLKARVIAEGVETWEQLLSLHEEGCDEAQGYLFSPPVTPSRALVLARSGFGGHPAPIHGTKRRA